MRPHELHKPPTTSGTAKSNNRRNFRVAPVALISAATLAVMVLFPLLAWGNPYPTRIFAYWLGGSAVALVLAFAAARFPSLPLGKPVAWISREINSLTPGVFAALAGGTATVIALLFVFVVFRGGASSTDELAQLWQARILLSGRLFLPVDANHEFFALDTVVDSVHWYSQFPIGGPLVLAVGEFLGAPWMMNPMLFGCATIAMYCFGRRAYGERTARTIALVFVAAPSISIMSATMMNHVATMALAATTLVCVAEWEQSRTRRHAVAWAAGIGLCLGWMASVRPLDALIVSVVVGLFQLSVFRRDWGRLWDWVVQSIAGTAGAAPLLLSNRAMNGSALTFGYDVNWGSAHGLGFHTDPYGHAFTVQMGLERMITYVGELNMFVAAWPVPTVILMIASLLLIQRATKWDSLLIGLFWAQLLAHGAYWGQGEFLGPRFLFTCMPTVVILIARLPHLLAQRFEVRTQTGVKVFFAACLGISWGIPQLPLNGWGLAGIAKGARSNLRVDVAEAVRTAGLDNALIFLREPFSARLVRLMWGTGLSRSETAELLWKKDACNMFEVVRRADAAKAPELTRTQLRDATAFTAGQRSMQSTDGVLNLTSPESLTPACKAEFDSDAVGGFVPFGVGMVREPIGRDGRIDAGVVYAADLGGANERLRARFGDRKWYRMSAVPGPDGRLTARLEPYAELPSPPTAQPATQPSPPAKHQ